MQINWKELARSTGYRSLRDAYIRDAHRAGSHGRPMRRKAELYAHFQWVIGRAQHYAHRQGVSVESVLDLWEAKRTYWWLNYYQECNQPRLPSGKPRNIRHMKPETYLRQGFHTTKEAYFKRLKDHRQSDARLARKQAGKKPRWSAERKKQAARIRAQRSL